MSAFSEITIIGGGIIGSTIARRINQGQPKLRIALFEKQGDLGMHTSTRNSAVIHSGVYYNQQSLKAKMCKKGNEMMTKYC